MHTQIAAALLLASMAVATPAARLVVDEGFTGGFTTISGAIAAAVDGDTILVKQHSMGIWKENLILDKGLSIFSYNGIDVGVFGTVTVTAATPVWIDHIALSGSMTVTQNSGSGGMLLTNTNVRSALTCTATGRAAKLRIDDSKLDSMVTFWSSGVPGVLEVTNSIVNGNVTTADKGTPGSTAIFIGNNLGGTIIIDTQYQCEIYSNRISGQLKLRGGGNIVGNEITAVNSLAPYLEAGGTRLVRFIANSFAAAGITSTRSQSSLKVYNNKFNFNLCHTYFHNTPTTGTIEFGNNYSAASASSNYYFISNGGSFTPVCTLNVFNNVCMYGNSSVVPLYLIGTATVYFNYNFCYNITDYRNFGGGVSTGNLGSGIPSGQTAYPDMGNPHPAYNDVDGTRSDMGPEGGAYPFSAYYGTPGRVDVSLRKPFVGFIDAPRMVKPGQTITIKAIGCTQ